MLYTPDILKPGLRVVFCGINPSLLSGATGHHFARPGNRFWKLLHEAGFTSRVLQPSEQEQLLDAGVGITNLVAGATRAADELTVAQLRDGATRLTKKITEFHPACVAVLGMQAYRSAFRKPKAAIGEQPEPLAGARVWLLPNPSGLQARYQLPEMVAMWVQLREAANLPPPR